MTTELIKTATRADWLALRKSGIGGQDFRIYRIERDQDAIDWLFEKADQFWVANVMAEQPP